jgi:predicted Zn finger-like uncharacterized protein
MTSCPSCSKQLRVPDELIGRQVKCPACGTMFTAGAASAPAVAAAPPSVQPMDIPGEPPTRRPSAGLMVPGILLLLVSLLNVGFAALCFKTYSDIQNHPEEIKKALDDMRTKMSKGLSEEEKKEFNSQMDFVEANMGTIYLAMAVLALVPALLSLPGAIQMMRSRSGALGWLAAFLNVLPLSICCCGGVPVSIWAMVALYKAGKS